MSGVITGFAIIAVVIGVGYVTRRTGLLGPQVGPALNRVAFYIAVPALLFMVLGRADIRLLFSSFLLVNLLSAVLAAVLYVVASRIWFQQKLPETVIGASASSYVNSNNIGLPVAVYVLGDPQWVAPTLLLQLLLLSPVILGTLDISTSGRVSRRQLLTQPIRNPLIIASLLGVVVAATGITLPEVVTAPLDILGGAAIPLVLMAFGMSLHGGRPLRPGPERVPTIVASVLKSLVMPVLAWALAALVFKLDPVTVRAVTVTAALPTAQNIYNFAAHYERGAVQARDAGLITTVAAVPVLILISLLLPM
ncbi:AEC family transporter [Nakamurella sp. YIM 132087]|uniref:AEC family transporter n=1 Tax=Nakamurella alba TaxID=2665158 RepID=A0A7K1FR40_9ACTN|nr:AEC family transporter [Nakamurella alba]MTD15264.1 AEC family transporter [Nakamurella alba]